MSRKPPSHHQKRPNLFVPASPICDDMLIAPSEKSRSQQKSQQQPTIVVNVTAPTSNTAAAVVNLFFPPFGHLVQGRFLMWFAWGMCFFVSAVLMLVGIGFILLPFAWVCCVLDAACYKPPVEQHQQPE